MVVHDHCRRGSIEGVAALRVGDVRSLSMLLIQRLPFRKLPMARGTLPSIPLLLRVCSTFLFWRPYTK
jgi:hypothetical protein